MTARSTTSPPGAEHSSTAAGRRPTATSPAATRARRASGARPSAPVGDHPYLPEGALLRRVSRERAVALSGARALFMQAAHPVAFAGFFSHTAALDNPHPRLARTALAVNTVIYGSEAQAREVQEVVGTMHARVRGQMRHTVGPFPAGTPFRGDDPELLHWILAAVIDSSYRAYTRYVGPLDDGERRELWQQWRMVGEIFGLEGDDMPRTFDGHQEYVRAMLASGDLVVSDESRELSRRVILNPPIPKALFAVKELINQVTIDSLPGDLQRQFGFMPVPGRGLAHFAFAQWLRRIGTPLAPDVVRYVPRDLMPREGRDYADLVAFVSERFGR